MEIRNKKYQKDLNLLIADLKTLESHVEELWQFLPIPVCLVNPAFNIVNASIALEEISGFKGPEIIGENIENFLKDFEEIKKELALKGIISGKEVIFLRRERKETPVSFSAKVRKDENGDITGYFLALIDLTEIKKKEKELREKMKEIESFNRLAIGRELKMVELKKEIEKMKKEEK